MNNKKLVCNNCIIRDYSKPFRTFRLVPIYNNRYAKKTENPVEYVNEAKKNNTLNTNRSNCGICQATTKQQKLTIRHKPTPWRMPYNHSRKSYICQKPFNCTETPIVKKINGYYFNFPENEDVFGREILFYYESATNQYFGAIVTSRCEFNVFNFIKTINIEYSLTNSIFKENDYLYLTLYGDINNFCIFPPPGFEFDPYPSGFIRNLDTNALKITVNVMDTNEGSPLVAEDFEGIELEEITSFENNQQILKFKITENTDVFNLSYRLKISVADSFLNDNGFVVNEILGSPDYPFNPNPTATIFYKLEHYRNNNVIAQSISNDETQNPWLPITYGIWDDLPLPSEFTPIGEYPEFTVNSVTLNRADCLYEKMKNREICSNDQVIKETKDKCSCPPTVISTKLTNKDGIRLRNSSNSYKSYLYMRAKLYEQNATGLLPENKIGENEYKIGTINGTVNNTTSGTEEFENCELTNLKSIGLSGTTFQYKKIPTATKKFKNNSNTSKSRLARLKYQTKIKASHINKSYNNCSAGDLCSKYITPGDNLKNKTQKVLCISKIIKNKRCKCKDNSKPTFFEDTNLNNEELERKRGIITNNYLIANIRNSSILKKKIEIKEIDKIEKDKIEKEEKKREQNEIICNRGQIIFL